REALPTHFSCAAPRSYHATRPTTVGLVNEPPRTAHRGSPMPRPASTSVIRLALVILVVLLLAPQAQAQPGLGAPTNFAAGTNPIGIAVGDLNRDGRPDLVVTNGTPGTISVLLATGDATFGAPTAFTVGTQ